MRLGIIRDRFVAESGWGTVFQRTPNHILPLGKRAYSDEERAEWLAHPERAKRAQEDFCAARDELWKAVILSDDAHDSDELLQLAQRHLEENIKDPALRAMLTPSHAFGCKRMGSSDDFYPALEQPNVELVPQAVVRIEPDAAVSASGRRFDVDTIILATGFIFGGSILHKIKRRDGQTVGEYQQGRPRAFQSVSVAECPNLFLVGGAGPNGMTWRGVSAGEIVTGYALDAMRYMDAHGIRAMQVKEEREVAWKREADERLASAPIVAGGCVNYYQDSHGYNKAAWPGTLRSMEQALAHFPADAYEVVGVGHSLDGDAEFARVED
ncbi:MAG TPA: hypothetical protein VJM09_01730 [Sphingobium sp.]|nr:hypothetical protein [Sphingobium sp.]